MSPINNHEQFKEIFGEYADVNENNELRLKGTFVGSEKESSILSSEDASMLSKMLCSLPKSYSITVVARAGAGTIKPSYVAYGIATIRVLTKNVDELENLFAEGVKSIDDATSIEQENNSNN